MSDLKFCPFCAYFYVPPEPVGTDFHGEIQSRVGTVPACDSCAVIAETTDTTQHLLAWLARRREIEDAQQKGTDHA